MSEIIKRTFQCTGCGMARPCFLTTNQEKGEIEFYDHTEHLKCALDETNQTAPNWTEVEANEVIKTHEQALPINSVMPCYCLECGWNGDISETTKEAVSGFENEPSEYIPVCPECSYDIRIQE